MSTKTLDSFHTQTLLEVGDKKYSICSLKRLEEAGHNVARLPFSLKILLENLLRHENGQSVNSEDIEALLNWDPQATPSQEISFTPARVILQDFTGVPAVVDLAAMRDALSALGGDSSRINPLLPSELVIDHSVQVDAYGSEDAILQNAEKDYERNLERYAFLRWGQSAFQNFKVVPPATGIVHQVNLEYLGRVVFDAEKEGTQWAYPDTLVGTDSHTTMINGLGVLGWGVGGIEAEAAMLGQPISMLIPQVVGFKLHGTLPEGVTATDLVLRVTEMLREKGVVGKFVEFYGDGLANLSLANRSTLSNMSPEFGSTCGIFPIDEETLDYLRFTGRSDDRVALVEAYARTQGMFRTDDGPDPEYTDTLGLDLSTVQPSLAGPKRPQDRVLLSEAKNRFADVLPSLLDASGDASSSQNTRMNGDEFELSNGSVVIAAITSCTNTSNPSVMIGAGLLARKAVQRGLTRKPWVKTSLAPGSTVVTEYLTESGLLPDLEALGFHVVGYGCTTCIGNSGPLPEPVASSIDAGNLVAVSVLSGNRNFEGRISSRVRANYLASPPLVVAYAIAGRMDMDITTEPLGQDSEGNDVFLKDIWPSQEEIRDAMRTGLQSRMFTEQYANVFRGDQRWQSLPIPEGDRFEWAEDSTYLRLPTFFSDMGPEPTPLSDIKNAHVLALLGDSVTTDHISPAGSIDPESPAGAYLIERGVEPQSFNSYGSRRGNHEVMMRGTFANVRLRNQLAPGTEGGWTRHLPDGETTSIFEASMQYQADGVPLIVIAGKEYGTGSSRDWAAKGTRLLGVHAVIAESFERIHRSNLIGMGVLPLQFAQGQSRDQLGLTGEETYSITGITELVPRGSLQVTATACDGSTTVFEVLARIDTPDELEYYRHGGILQYVLRQML
ncbi:MAG: aconitate hydratase AcnA [Planctomycetota bacterium]|jgi:aconitate hydratase|nr:aconitate hydratase AcnA [Planctomycetota bacterium]